MILLAERPFDRRGGPGKGRLLPCKIRIKSDKNKTNERIDSYFKEMEIGLHEALGRKVKVEYGKNKGALILEFYDRDDLSELAKRLTKE